MVRLNLLCGFLLPSLLWSCRPTYAKTTSGDFRLSGLNTEHVIGSFAVSAAKDGYMSVSFTAKTSYQHDSRLRLRLYKDDQWPKYQRTPACVDKIKFAAVTESLTWEHKFGKYVAESAIKLDNLREKRPHYYYFVIDDCSLEEYMHDDSVPKIHYKLQTYNDGNHLSADEKHMRGLHLITLLVSAAVALLLAVSIVMQLNSPRASVHAAMVLVMAAAGSDAGSSLFEIIHLAIYSRNGVGSYVLDALSAHLEAICDALVALLLLSIAAGWTLPSDVITTNANEPPIQRILGGLRTPFEAIQSFSPAAMLAIGILLAHVILAQWGRIYNDDFDSYHELEHLPGKLLMCLKILFGLCHLISCFQTRMRCPVSLHLFYLKLAFVGTVWFGSLPFITLVVAHAVPYYLRHWTVCLWSAVLQSSSIVLLSWLVTSHSSAYHKFSHISTSKENLTDSLSAATKTTESSTGGLRSLRFGNAKIRLD